MINSITVINHAGNTLVLDLRNSASTGFLIKNITGLGPGTANINTSDISYNDGSVFKSARMTQRNIVLELIFAGDIESARQKTYEFFSIKKEVELIIETDNRTVTAKGYTESNEPEIFSKQEGTSISIICPDPYLYSAGLPITTLFYGVEKTLEFPLSNESLTTKVINLGNISNKTISNIWYSGDLDAGITIRIHAIGDVTNLDIYNLTTSQYIKIDSSKLATLTGSDIIAGDDITIETSKGLKSITLLRQGETYNILNCLGRDTTWLTLVHGDNLFAFVAEEGTTNVQFKIENKIIYEGV